MRKSIVFLLFVLLTPVSGRSQELKFGYVEDQRILNQLPAVKEVQRILDQETTLWEKRFKERQLFLKAYVDSVTALKAGLEKARQDTSKTSKPEKQPEVSVNLPAPGDSAAADSSGGKNASAAAAKVEKKMPADTLAMLSEIAR